MHILVTAANSAQAQKLKKELNKPGTILGDYFELPAFMLTSAQVVKLPDPSSAAYNHEMLTLCLDRQIDTIYALRDEELVLLKEAEQLFSEYGIKLVDRTW